MMKTLAQILDPQLLVKSKVDLSTTLTSLKYSTQDCESDSAFFALQGKTTDGHKFLSHAHSLGVKALFVEKEDAYDAFENTVLVTSTRKALAYAASAWYDHPSKKLKIYGITGTNGKTTSTFLLHQAWKHLGFESGVIGTVSTLIGDRNLPSSLTTPNPIELQFLLNEMVLEKIPYVAMEVSSIALDQSRTWGTHFQTINFTNFTPDHLDYHGQMEDYFAAKRLLYSEAIYQKALGNADDPWIQKILKEFRVAGWSMKDPSQKYYLKVNSVTASGSQGELLYQNQSYPFETPLVGMHNVANGLGVASQLIEDGHDPKAVLEALKKAHGAPGRLEQVSNQPKVFVDFAHSEDALKNVLLTLQPLKQGRIITVFGCGGDRDRAKRPKMGAIAAQYSDIAILTSDNPRTEDPESILDHIEAGVNKSNPNIHRQVDRRKAIHKALEMARHEDIVLVAGKGHENYQILGTQKLPFDDKQVILEYYC